MHHVKSWAKDRLSKTNVWKAVDVVHQPWLQLDSIAQKAGVTGHHNAFDLAVSRMKAKSIFHPYGFYPDGWGRKDVPAKFFREALLEDSVSLVHMRTHDIDVHLTPRVDEKYFFASEGSFETPVPDTRDLLPEESHTVHFQLLTPKSWETEPGMLPSNLRERAKKREVVIVLPGTGEIGFRRRKHYLGRPLAEKGIASIIVEGPFYGKRRPPLQRASKLRYVSDLPVLGKATVEEAVAIVNWVQQSGQFGNVTLAGNSMGGLHSAMTASVIDIPVGVASWLGPPTAAPVFSWGALSKGVEWEALERDCDRELDEQLDELDRLYAKHGTPRDHVPLTPPEGPFEDTKRAMMRFLSLTDLSHFKKPVCASACFFVRAAHDEYIPPQLCEATWEAVARAWDNEPNMLWTRGGHVSASIFPVDSVMSIIEGAFKQLDHSSETAVESLRQEYGDYTSRSQERERLSRDTSNDRPTRGS